MMYSNKLSACIKASGKVLREFKDKVYIPFGQEYQISLKNLNSKRAIVNITIDGTEAVPGGLVLNVGQTIDLERFVKNGNLNQGNRFKFIERTSSIEQHRGIGAEDGLVKIEWQFEIDYQKYEYPKKWEEPGCWPPYNPLWLWRDSHDTGTPRYGNVWMGGVAQSSINCSTDHGKTKGILRSANISGQLSAQACSISTQGFTNDVGITVPGSVSDQKFSTAYSFPTESEKHVMILHLVGETEDNKPVVQPVTVKHKPKCQTCGRTNKIQSKFCTNCGTSLTIL